MNCPSPQVICCHHEGRHRVCCQILDHLHMGHNALNTLHLALRAITTRTLCQICHMACLHQSKKMQNVVLSILKVSEHDNQPELEHELLPQYVIDTREHDGNVCFFRNDILQYETATCNNMSSAETKESRA